MMDAPCRMPRLYLNGFPKSGLHMLEQAASTFVSSVATHNWFGTSAWSTKVNNRDLAFRAIKAIPAGHFAKGHMAYDKEFEQYLWTLGVGVAFIYRDLRDVLVSQFHHIKKADGVDLKHPGADLFRALPSDEDIMIACIEGLDIWSGLFDRWAMYAGWLDCDWIHKIQFEKMRKREKPECARLFRYALKCVNYEESDFVPEGFNTVVLEMVQRMRNRKISTTFRKGKLGEWRKEFTPRVVECFKANDPGWLVELGYEEDDTWQ